MKNIAGVKTLHHRCCNKDKYPKKCQEVENRNYQSCTCCKVCPSGQYVSGCTSTNPGQCITRSSGSSGSSGSSRSSGGSETAVFIIIGIILVFMLFVGAGYAIRSFRK